MTRPSQISDRILEAALAKKLAPGSRLGEKELAALFGCSRTLVREALIRLEARGIVEVSARRGWYLVEPTHKDAREAFEARLVIETGLLRAGRIPDASALKRLHAHIAEQKAALKGGNDGLRSFLLGDFHVRLAEALGNGLLAETIQALTVRTTLAAMLHQSDDDAAQSCAEHAGIVAALAASDLAAAERLMAAHLANQAAKLPIPSGSDALARLRQTLAPVERSARILRTRSELRRGRDPSSMA